MSIQAWDEYLAWTRGADPNEYALTEERAWVRLQAALLLESLDFDRDLFAPQSDGP